MMQKNTNQDFVISNAPPLQYIPPPPPPPLAPTQNLEEVQFKYFLGGALYATFLIGFLLSVIILSGDM